MLQEKIDSLWGTLNKCFVQPIVSAVPVNFSHQVEMFKTERFTYTTCVTPQLIALTVVCLTFAVEAISILLVMQEDNKLNIDIIKTSAFASVLLVLLTPPTLQGKPFCLKTLEGQNSCSPSQYSGRSH